MTYGLGLPGGIGGLLHLNQGGAHYSYLYDGKGNVTALLDGSAGVAAAYQYDPFGKPMGPANTVSQPFQFSTKAYDDKTGLSYYGYRFYVPSLGRWLTRDPIGERGGINLYGFVENNPVNFVDPLGTDVFWAGISSAAFINFGGNTGYAGQSSFGLAFDTSTGNFYPYKSAGKTCPPAPIQGLGYGTGVEIGALKGGIDDFFGGSQQDTSYYGPVSISSITSDSGASGTSATLGGKGMGFGNTSIHTHTSGW